MFTYLVKYQDFIVKICVENKDELLASALQEMRLLTEIYDDPVMWMFDKAFDEFYILTDSKKALDGGVIKLEDAKRKETTNAGRFVIFFSCCRLCL